MGAIVNALTIEGMRAYGATFLVFSDYMRGAIRMAALMEIPSIFIYTHDSIGVGEDGPTHQPIEHLASLRAMPNLDVIRPADVNEAFLAWHWLLESCSVPTALILSRQKLPVIDRERIPDDAIERGAYVLGRSRRGRRSGADPDRDGLGGLPLPRGRRAARRCRRAGRLDAEHLAVQSTGAGLPRRGAAAGGESAGLGRGRFDPGLESLGRRRGERASGSIASAPPRPPSRSPSTSV